MPARREISARPSWPTLSDSLIRSIRTRFSVHTANAREQIEIAFENVKAALTSVGANFENVVKLNNYIVDIGTNIAHPAREGPCCTAGPSGRVDRALECHCLGFATLARAIRRAIRRGAYCLYAAIVSESRFDATRPIASTIVQACLERLSATTLLTVHSRTSENPEPHDPRSGLLTARSPRTAGCATSTSSIFALNEIA
jgi:hypothetical protein